MNTATRPAPGAAAPDDQQRTLLSTMLRLRRFEEKAGMLYALGTLGTPCPLGIGREGAVAAIAETLHPGDIFLAMGTSPAFDLALGMAPTHAFQRLLTAPSETDAANCLLRLPGELPRCVSVQEAFALLAHRSETVVVVASGIDEITGALHNLSNRVLPVMIVPSDRKPESWSHVAPWSVRECDGTDAIGLCETLTTVRETLASGHGGAAIAILTPPYAGHARDAGRRMPSRRDTPDPIALCRQRLLGGGRIDEAGVAAMETAIRDEVAAAGRAIALACT